MLVKEIMKKNVKIIRPDDNMKKAAEIMNSNKIGCLVVVEGDGDIVGIITERDILEDVVAVGKSSDQVLVKDAMKKDVIFTSPEASLEEAADLMNKNKIKKLPVIENGKLVGIITASDLITYESKLIEKISELLVKQDNLSMGG